jgi:hypothetical protein
MIPTAIRKGARISAVCSAPAPRKMDLARQGITLREGMPLTLYSDDLGAKGQPDELRVDGVVSYSDTEHCWVAAIDWSAIHHASDEQKTPA